MTRKKIPGQLTEDHLQKWCISYARQVHPRLLFIHIPNGGSRNLAEAAKLKAMGTLSGVCDLLCIMPNGRCHWVEMKVPGGVVSKNQEKFMEELDRRRHSWEVCWCQGEFEALCRRLQRVIDTPAGA